jgi:hypothetical protein
MVPTLLVMIIFLPAGGEDHWAEHFNSHVACHFKAAELRRRYGERWPGTRVRYECRQAYTTDIVPATTG